MNLYLDEERPGVATHGYDGQRYRTNRDTGCSCNCGCGTVIIIALLLYIIHLLGGF